MKNIINKIRKIIYLISNLESILNKLNIDIGKLDTEISLTNRRMDSVIDFHNERTVVHSDIHYGKHGSATIICVGHYQNHDYVNCYQVSDITFSQLVDYLRKNHRDQNVGYIDTPFGGMEFSAVYPHDKF